MLRNPGRSVGAALKAAPRQRRCGTDGGRFAGPVADRRPPRPGDPLPRRHGRLDAVGSRTCNARTAGASLASRLLV